jgi:hypothetical protein
MSTKAEESSLLVTVTKQCLLCVLQCRSVRRLQLEVSSKYNYRLKPHVWSLTHDNILFVTFATVEPHSHITSQPILRRNPCSSLDKPPTTTTVLMPSGCPNLLVSSSICWASSRVGAKIMEYGPCNINRHQGRWAQCRSTNRQCCNCLLHTFPPSLSTDAPRTYLESSFQVVPSAKQIAFTIFAIGGQWGDGITHTTDK